MGPKTSPTCYDAQINGVSDSNAFARANSASCGAGLLSWVCLRALLIDTPYARYGYFQIAVANAVKPHVWSEGQGQLDCGVCLLYLHRTTSLTQLVTLSREWTFSQM